MGTPSNKLTSVQIVGSDNDLVLVQWTNSHDVPQRSWVPRTSLIRQAGLVADVKNPEQGIPYGVEVWRLISMKATAKDFDRELKNRGIWTIADLRARPNEVMGALVAVYGVDLGTLYQALSRYEKELKTEA